MRRKVIQLAGKTFVVSLPSAWAKKYGIHKSDELEIVEKHNTLLITTPSALVVPQKTTIDLSGASVEFAKSMISTLHKIGYDEIEFLFDKPEMKDLIQERTAELIGFEVIEQGKKRCVIKNVSGDLSHELDSMIRRTFLVTLSLAKESYECVAQGRTSELKSLLHLEKTNNRLTNYCHRLLNKNSKGAQSSFLYTIIWVLEKIGDAYKEICEVLHAHNEAISSDALELYAKANAHVEEYYHLFYSTAHEKMVVLREKNKGLRKQIYDYRECSSGKELQLLLLLHAIVQHVYDCFGSTTGRLVLEQQIKNEA